MRLYGLTEEQARTQYAGSIEGRLYLRKIISLQELQAAQTYRQVVERHMRDIGAPALPGNSLRSMLPAGPPPSGAQAALNAIKYEWAEEALERAGTDAIWAVGCVCRKGMEVPERYHAALGQGLHRLAVNFGLDTETN